MATLTLLVLRCGDLEASRRFYAALGLVLITEQHGSGPVHYSCQLGATVLELYPSTSATTSTRLGIDVPSVTHALRAVRSLGGRIDREPTPEHGSCLVRDPDGNAVELTQLNE
jgi:catechol 2,3-dioxygenase-like lactoylglutathione lyase family enzyme